MRRWFQTVWSTQGDELLEITSADTVTFIRFLRLACYVMFSSALLDFAVLVPLYGTSD